MEQTSHNLCVEVFMALPPSLDKESTKTEECQRCKIPAELTPEYLCLLLFSQAESGRAAQKLVLMGGHRDAEYLLLHHDPPDLAEGTQPQRSAEISPLPTTEVTVISLSFSENMKTYLMSFQDAHQFLQEPASCITTPMSMHTAPRAPALLPPKEYSTFLKELT